MEAGFIVAVALAAIVGVSVGITIERFRHKNEHSRGILNVAYSDLYSQPDLFLTLQVPVEDVVAQKHVRFDVNILRSNSQK